MAVQEFDILKKEAITQIATDLETAVAEDAAAAQLAETNAKTAQEITEGFRDETEAFKNAAAAIVSGGPRGIYADLAALILADPDHLYTYVTLDNGYWNYWNGSAFIEGMLYQAPQPVESEPIELSYILGGYYGVAGDLNSHTNTRYAISPIVGTAINVTSPIFGGSSSILFDKDMVFIAGFVNTGLKQTFLKADYPTAEYIGVSSIKTEAIVVTFSASQSTQINDMQELRRDLNYLYEPIESEPVALDYINGGYYGVAGDYNAHGGAKRVLYFPITSDIMNVTSPIFGGASSILLDKDFVFIAGFVNTGVKQIFSKADYPTAEYINLSTGINENIIVTFESSNSKLLNSISDLDKKITEDNELNFISYRWNIPAHLYMNESLLLWYYKNSLFDNFDRFEKSYKLTISAPAGSGRFYNDFGILNSKGVDYDILLKIEHLGNANKVLSQKEITVHNMIKLTNSTKNVLVIGDSFIANTYGDGILKYMQDFSTEDANVINFKGTQLTEYGINAEAHGGWSEASFIGSGSPFYNGSIGKFDFSNYLSVNNIGDIDEIVFFLGMNGGLGEDINKMINGDGNVLVSSSIRDALPFSKIKVCMVPPYWLDPAIDNALIPTSPDEGMLGRIWQNIHYFTLFDNNSDDIMIVPMTNFSRTYGYRMWEMSQVQFDISNEILGDISIPKYISVYDQHPSSSGAKGIAYMIYNYIFQGTV